MELVSALKEGATSSLLATLVVKPEQAEGVVVVDVERSFPSEPEIRLPRPHLRVRQGRVFYYLGMPKLPRRH